MKNEKSLKDTIYNAIMEDIFLLEYKPGDILNEKALVEKYECSKSPVREALLELCKDNVLRNIPRYGYEVVKITMDDVREMIEFRYLLEAGILRKQYSDLTEVHFSVLEDIDKQCRKRENTMWEHWSLNTEFHLKLIGFGKCCSAFRPFSPGLDNQVDFHDSIIERIVNFYHAHENLFDYITTYL